jgi:MFS family permease
MHNRSERLPGGGLVRYLTAAILARAADAGAGLGLILLALDPPTHLNAPGRTSGLLVGALTAPHLLGPLVARRLDTAADIRPALATAFGLYAVALATAAATLGALPVVVTLSLVAVAGATGPLLTGGLSSQLGDIADGSGVDRRRAEGWDAITFGVAGTAGPVAVAALATVLGPRPALFAVSALVAVAALLALRLPPRAAREQVAAVPPDPGSAVLIIARRGPLRRVTYATMATALSGAALTLLAVTLGNDLGHRHGSGALLAAMFGVGNLVGSLVVTAFPLRGEPEKLTTLSVYAIAVAYVLCALAPSYPMALAAFVLAGVVNAPFFTATLAARDRYAPDGGRARVFVTVAGLKVAAGSLGSVLAGAVVAAAGPRWPIAAGAALTALAALATTLERLRTKATAGVPRLVP